MKQVFTRWTAFARNVHEDGSHTNEEGQGLAEYGLILALVSILCVAALSALQGGISGTLASVTATL